jgi:hypothetical protein
LLNHARHQVIQFQQYYIQVYFLEVLKNRTVIHFGHVFDYSTNAAVVPTSQIPPIFVNLLSELKTDGIPIEDVEFNQLTVNVYEPGQGKSVLLKAKLQKFRHSKSRRHSLSF